MAGPLDYLPSDLQSNIFGRLSLKDLLRAKAVSKHMLFLIESPVLRSSLPSRGCGRKLVIYAGRVQDRPYPIRETVLLTVDGPHNNIMWMQEMKPVPDSYHAALVGVSSGLVCFSFDEPHMMWLTYNRFLVWNPLTFAFCYLPHAPTFNRTQPFIMEFEFVDFTNEYKVLKVQTDKGEPTRAHVYRSGTDVWDSFEVNIPDQVLQSITSAVTSITVGNHLHFKVGSRICTNILRFDLVNDRFDFIDPPPQDNMSQYFLGVVEDKLGFFECYDHKPDLEIWLHINHVWVHCHRLQLHVIGWECLLAYWPAGRAIIPGTDNGPETFNNICYQSRTNLLRHSCAPLRFGTYEESLMSVNRRGRTLLFEEPPAAAAAAGAAPDEFQARPPDTKMSDSSEEFERRLPTENEQIAIIQMEDAEMSKLVKVECNAEEQLHDDEGNSKVEKRQALVQKQNKELQEINYLGRHLQSLAHAASGYQKVLEENRKLYNQVQDPKGSIRVYCRVRPYLPGLPNKLTTISSIDSGKITLMIPSKTGKKEHKSFTFNQVFGQTTSQEVVFLDVQPLVRPVLAGYNVCVFAYGQTGSGKTYTMRGPDDLTEETLGVNYRALTEFFSIPEQRKNMIHYVVSVKFLEIYEQVRDFLVTDGFNNILEIRNSSQKGLNVPDANLILITSTLDAMEVINIGQKNRSVSSTAMNKCCFRSHSCLTVHVQGKDLMSGAVLRRCMHLFNLAGSERVDRSVVVADRLKEAQRGQAKTLMFAHISPEADAIGETISKLKFAELVSTVELGAARASKVSADVKELKEQIDSLKVALANREQENLEQLKLLRVMSADSSISNSSWQSVENMLNNCRQPMDEVGNIEEFDSTTVITETVNRCYFSFNIYKEWKATNF